MNPKNFNPIFRLIGYLPRHHGTGCISVLGRDVGIA
jgi:hypothetical protein